MSIEKSVFTSLPLFQLPQLKYYSSLLEIDICETGVYSSIHDVSMPYIQVSSANTKIMT